MSSRAELLVAVGSWTICSVGMLVFNKLAIKAFSPACTLVAVQFLFSTVAMLLPPFCSSLHIGSLRDVLRWMTVIPFFTGMILTSILALKDAPMTLVLTFRAMSPMISLVVERFYPNPLRLSPLMLLSLFGCLFGMWLYLHDIPKHHMTGVFWALLNNLFAVGDRLLQRLMLGKDQRPVDISKTGVTLLNNSLGLLPLLLACVLLTNEAGDIEPAWQKLQGDRWGQIWVAMSCLVGVGISYTGVWVQSLMSATSMLVLINANKFAILFLEVLVMRSKTVGTCQILGATLSILFSILYGKAREAVEQDAEDEYDEELKSLTEDEDDAEHSLSGSEGPSKSLE